MKLVFLGIPSQSVELELDLCAAYLSITTMLLGLDKPVNDQW